MARTRTLIAVLAGLALAPATAAAAPIPAGDYSVKVNGGTLDVGTRPIVSTIPAGSSTSLTVPEGATTVAWTPTITVPQVAVPPTAVTPTETISGTFTWTITDFNASINPSDGTATATAKLYGTFSGFVMGGPAAGSLSCQLGLGDPLNPLNRVPVPLTLSSASPGGSPWSSDTGGLALANATFTLPTPGCGMSATGLLGAAHLSTLMGAAGTAGNNSLVLQGLIPPPPPPGGTEQPSSTTPTQEQPPTESNQVAEQCVVPAVVGTRLKRAKALVTAAGCTYNVTKRQRRGRRGPWTVIKQSPAAGTALAAGAPVKLVARRKRR